MPRPSALVTSSQKRFLSLPVIGAIMVGGCGRATRRTTAVVLKQEAAARGSSDECGAGV